MTYQEMLKSLRRDLRQAVNLKHKEGCQNFFIEKIKVYGVPIPEVRKIAKPYYPLVRRMEKSSLFKLCEELFKSGYNEEAVIATSYLSLRLNELLEDDFVILESFLNKYINNWYKDDDYCTHLLGPFLARYPVFLPKLLLWTESNNPWVRRASAVSLIPLMPMDNMDLAFEISEKLFQDEEDLVQKAYGWLLKVSSRFYEQEVFDFVLKNKERMPRTALRYAIEKMPPDLKKVAMK